MVETATQEQFKKDLLKVHHALLAARDHYNIWYIYKHDRPKYVDVMDRYLGFFSTSISAQFTAKLLTLSKVLDKKYEKKNKYLFVS
jgi:hypothetical protein